MKSCRLLAFLNCLLSFPYSKVINLQQISLHLNLEEQRLPLPEVGILRQIFSCSALHKIKFDLPILQDKIEQTLQIKKKIVLCYNILENVVSELKALSCSFFLHSKLTLCLAHSGNSKKNITRLLALEVVYNYLLDTFTCKLFANF